MTPGTGSPAGRIVSVATLEVGSLGTNCYVLQGAGASGPAVLIDPGAAPGEILSHLEDRGLEPGLILLTHGHSDHLGALPEVLARWPGASVGVSQEDLPMLGDTALNLSAFVGAPVDVRPRSVRLLSEGDPIEAGGLALEVIATPGHTRGGLCFFCGSERQPLLFSGDTLFAGSVGRTDLPGGSWEDLAASLRRLALLPPATLVYPGHGPATSLAAELRANPYLTRVLNT